MSMVLLKVNLISPVSMSALILLSQIDFDVWAFCESPQSEAAGGIFFYVVQ